MNQDKLNVIFTGLKHYWQNVEIEDKKSIFSKEKITEKEFKKLCRRSGGTTLKIIKAIKMSILKKGKCYYSQRELAEHFKVSQHTINQSMKLIEKTLNTKFLPFPKEIINNGLSKHCSYRQILIPPSLYRNLILVDENNPILVKRNPILVTKEPDTSYSGFFKNFKQLKITTYIPIYNNLYTDIKYSISLLRKEKEILISSQNPKILSTNENSFLGEEQMKHKLSIVNKRNVIDYKDYGLNPKEFMNHVEVHQYLSKWFDILIDKGVAPKRELTKMFLNTWNSIGNPKFSKHKPNPKSKTFKLICLALTYRMWSENIDLEDVEAAINKFVILTDKQGKLKYSKRYDCLTSFLWNSQTYVKRDNFQLCLKRENEMLGEYYNYNTKYQKALNGVKKLFGKTFYTDRPDLNKEEFQTNYRKFVDFTNEMVKNHTTKEMVGFNPQEYENEEVEDQIDSFYRYIKSYFVYVYERIQKTEYKNLWSVNTILGDKMKSEFVLWVINSQPGWEGFMKELVIEEKPKKFKLKTKKSS